MSNDLISNLLDPEVLWITEMMKSKDNYTKAQIKDMYISKYKKTERTFHTKWKEAENRAHPATIDKDFWDVKRLISYNSGEATEADRNERMALASNIARGQPRVVQYHIGDKKVNKVIIPTDGDRLRALEFLARVNGDYDDGPTVNLAPTVLSFNPLLEDPKQVEDGENRDHEGSS